MAERDHDNVPASDLEEVEEANEEFIMDGGLPLCSKCLKPCHPLQYYCDSCDSNEVINPLASYMPFVRIRFNMGMLRKMCREVGYDEEASMIFRVGCLFVIILVALILLMGTTI